MYNINIINPHLPSMLLDKKKAPNKLQVEDSKQDDNSIVEMTQAKMDELKIFKGDTVILRGKSINLS